MKPKIIYFAIIIALISGGDGERRSEYQWQSVFHNA